MQTFKLSANEGNISAAPTFGMPSRDSHALRDDDASIDRELRTQFVYTPAKATPGNVYLIIVQFICYVFDVFLM